MLKSYKIISLLLALLMMAAAAITVNKTLFPRELQSSDHSGSSSADQAPSITSLPDGSLILHTTSLPGTISGYAGPVNLDIAISNGKISKITPLPNAETPSFFNRAAAIIPQWIGKTPAEALNLQVDAVSGATFSSQALITNINAGLEYYQGETASRHSSTPWKLWVALAVTLVACILPLFVHSRVYHTFQMIANIIVLGFWCGQFLDYSLMLKFLSEGISIPAGLAAIAMLIAAFIYPLFGRPQHYCNHICPLGSAQQLAGQLCGYKIRISPKTVKALDWFRKLLWAALMILLWADCLTGWMDLELFQAFQFESASWWIIGAALFFVLLSLFISRPYCRFVCPTGSLFKRAENIG